MAVACTSQWKFHRFSAESESSAALPRSYAWAGSKSMADRLMVSSPSSAPKPVQPARRACSSQPAAALRGTWVALRATICRVLEIVTLADIVDGRLPPDIAALVADDDAWTGRGNRYSTRRGVLLSGPSSCHATFTRRSPCGR